MEVKIKDLLNKRKFIIQWFILKEKERKINPSPLAKGEESSYSPLITAKGTSFVTFLAKPAL